MLIYNSYNGGRKKFIKKCSTNAANLAHFASAYAEWHSVDKAASSLSSLSSPGVINGFAECYYWVAFMIPMLTLFCPLTN